MKNKFRLYIVISMIIVAFIAVITINHLTKERIDEVRTQQYNNESIIINKEIDILIQSKKESTLSLALALSDNYTIVKALKQKDKNLIDLKRFSKLLSDMTRYKNVWFQVIDNKGNSFYRSWVDQSGDSLMDARVDIEKMLKEPKVLSTISVGKFDMTFKSIVPLYDNKKFIGILEVITHFNSISKRLSQSGYDAVIITDKKYKQQIKNPFTNKFISDYYVANFDAKEKYLNRIEINGLNYFISPSSKYKIDSKHTNSFIVSYRLNDINNDIMGYIIVFKDLESFKNNEIEFLEQKLLGYAFFTILFIFIIGYIILNKKYNQNILKQISITKKAQNLLEKKSDEQKELLSLFDKGDSVLFKYDKNLQIKYISKSIKKIVGYSKEQFESQELSYKDILDPAYQEQFSNNLTINSADGDLEYFKQEPYKLITKDNKQRWVLENTLILRDKKNKQIISYLGYIVDITEQKTKDKILFEQSKMASMGEMIGNIAHQWRQPLSVISTAATALKLKKEFNDLSDQYFDETCDMIDKNSQFLSKTIDDFRDFIQGERKIENFRISSFVESFLNLIAGSIKANSIKFIVEQDENIRINNYPNELNQSLLNIYNNAKDALKVRDETDRYIFMNITKLKEYITITIKDSGGGIPENVINNIFEPYFTTKHKSQGTGLGLSMTYKMITDGMHGTINVKNETFIYNDNKYSGATFVITLQDIKTT